MVRVALALVAGGAGLVVLLGYFLPELRAAQALLLRWGMILASAAVLVGILNLASVHLGKLRHREKNAPYSAVLIASLAATFVLGLLLKPGHPVLAAIINAIVVPAEGTFMALLSISLLSAGVRLLQRRLDLMSILFVASAIAVLLSSARVPSIETPIVDSAAVSWLTDVFSLSGARGILLGVSLGAIATGLRVLLGADRPYGDG